MSLPLVPDANHPAFPTRSKVDDWEIKRPVPLDCAEEMAVIGRRCAQAKPSRELIPTSRIGADPFDTEHRPETSQGAGESHETNAESRTGRTNARARGQKKELREAKRRAEKIKNKSISMEK